jgi:hypothetical protein
MDSKPRDGFYRLYDSANGQYVSQRIFSRSEAKLYLSTHRSDPAIKSGDHYMIGNDDADTIEFADLQ